MEFYFNEIPLFNKSKINMIKVLIKMIRRNRMLSNSKLGFGLMRLPKDKQGQIKLDEVQRMVDSYMERGFNYFDTAYVYEGSEEAIRQTLVEKYPRDVYTLADKLPAWKLTCQEDVERIFQESLNRTGADYFDFYLLHSVEKSHYPTYEKYQCFDFIQEMKKQGKIKYMGFSFHDDADFLDKVLTEHPEIDFVQLQLNYLDWENGVIQSRRNYEVARKHHKPIIVMEPIKGGTLASFSDDIERIYKDYAPQKSIASWAMRYVASLDGVMTILSGMSNAQQMNDHLDTMTHFEKINNEEAKLIKQVTDQVLSYPTIPYTKYRYCTPGCPMHIQIPDLFTAYNSAKMYGENRRYQTYYKDHSTGDYQPAKACIACGQCESVCPQHLEIISLLKEVSEVFDS